MKKILLLVVLVYIAAVYADDEATSPSYIMPAAFPTSYYSQFLPPYANFNPFYPLSSLSYSGPALQRQPRAFNPYYYYGGPIQWGAGPVPAGTAAVPPPSFLEAEAEVDDEVDEEAEDQVEDQAEEETEEAVEEDVPSFLETSAEADDEFELERSYQEAAYQATGGVNPIQRLKESISANNFARGAIWADKFQKYTENLAKSDRNKRIAEMRAAAEPLTTGGFQ